MRSKEKKKTNLLKKIIVVALFTICICIVINLAPNYIQNKEKERIKVIINNSNVTSSLKQDVFVDENEIIYLSFEDIENFFDGEIYYDKQYNQIITTSDTKLASLEIGKKQMYVNSSKVTIYGTVIEKDETYYLPFSEMKNVYDVDVKYSEDSKIITIDSLSKEQKKGNSSKNANVKYKPTFFSKNIDSIKKGESVIVIAKEGSWYKIRTTNGNIGYVKDITNIYLARENIENKSQIEGKVSLVWDYFSEYAQAPTRTSSIKGVNVVSPTFATLVKLGKGELKINIGTAGTAYINWAHNNNYKVWASVSNNSYQETTSEILNDYKLREELINKIVDMTISNNLDGINIDFEYIKHSDKAMFTRFIIELAPRLREYGKVLSVDVTAPDGSEDWSMCYDRHRISKAADYIVFMAYDQNGISSPKEGTTAGADWIEVNIKKFLGQEDVEANKIILGMPFYTRLWKETSNGISSTVVIMKNINSTLPSGVQKTWNENLKQYYVEYSQNGTTYKMWIEDEESIKAKFELMNKYNLAGAAYWRKDFENENIWNVVAEEIDK